MLKVRSEIKSKEPYHEVTKSRSHEVLSHKTLKALCLWGCRLPRQSDLSGYVSCQTRESIKSKIKSKEHNHDGHDGTRRKAKTENLRGGEGGRQDKRGIVRSGVLGPLVECRFAFMLSVRWVLSLRKRYNKSTRYKDFL